MNFTNFYLHVLTTKDNVGNSCSKTYTIKVDKTPPSISFDTNGCDLVSLGQEAKTIIRINDNLSGTNIQYGRWMQSSYKDTFYSLSSKSDFTGEGGWSFTNNSESLYNPIDLLGYWRLWIYTKDMAGNENISYTNNFVMRRDNLNLWLFQYPSTFTKSFDDSSNINSVTFKGIGGWEIFYIPIKTVPGKEYSFSFKFQNLSTYTTGKYQGIELQILNKIENNDNINNEITSTYYLPKNITTLDHHSIKFSAQQNTTYIAFNLGTVDDGQAINFKIGDFELRDYIP